MEKATQTGATASNAAPNSIDEAAQRIGEIFEKPAKKQVKPEEAADTNSESEEEVKTDSSEVDTQEEEVTEGQETETAEEGETRALTSLEDVVSALGVDSDALMSIKVKTKVDGVDEEATLAQLIKGYQLEGHVNRKSMEVSELKKELEKKAESFESEKKTQLGQINQAAAIAHRLLVGEYSAIDWAKLEKDDPIEYLTKKDQFQKYNASLQNIYGVIQQEQSKELEAQKTKLKEYVNEQQQKLAAKLPGWTDEKVRSKEYGDLVSFLRSELGVTKEELDGILDHRFYEIAYDAKRYRELMKKDLKANKDRKTTTFVKSGAPKGPAVRGAAQISELKRNHSKHKSLDSAAELIGALIQPKR